MQWPAWSVRPKMLLSNPTVLSDMVADGTVDFGPAAAGSPLDFMVWRGEHRFLADTVVNRNVVFAQDANIRPAEGVTVTLNGRVYADPHQHIFDISDGGRVIGRFGNVVISPCWWGATGDYNPLTNAGWNNYDAFIACVDARHSGGNVKAHIEVPTGNYRILGSTRPAIPNPLYPAAPGQPYQPEHLSEAGIIQLYIGDTLTGRGKASSGLTFSNLCTGGGWAIPVGGVDSSGPPSFVGGLFIGTPPNLPNYAGLAGGIGGFANGLDIEDAWVTSLAVGVRLDSTSQTATRIKTEYCGDGLRIHHGNTTVRTYESNLDGNAIVAEFRAAAAPCVISDFLIYNPNGGLSGGYGVVGTGVNTKLQLADGYIEAYADGGQYTDALAGFDCASIQTVNVEVIVHGNSNAARFAGGKDIQVRSLKARLGSGTSTSGAGLVIEDGITGIAKVDIDGFNCEGAFKDAAQIFTSGFGINLANFVMEGTLRYGLSNLRSITFTANNIQAVNCGEAGIFDRIEDGVGGQHSYANILCTRLGAGTQAVGVKYQCNDVNGVLRITGGSTKGNGTSAYDSTGSTYTNTSTQVSFLNVA